MNYELHNCTPLELSVPLLYKIVVQTLYKKNLMNHNK